MTSARTFAMLAFGAVCAGAHDLTVKIELAEPAVIVHASYDGAEPAVNADVEVLAPGRSLSPFQSGATDRNGRFAFVPDAGGSWAATVDDGFGHRRQQTVEVAWNTTGVAPSPTRDWRDAAIGLAAILGLTGLFYWSRARDHLRRADGR